MGEDQRTTISRLRNWFFGITGHLVFLFQTTPFVWAGLMTFPLFGFIISFLIGGVTTSNSDFVLLLFYSPTLFTIICDLGLVLWLFSIFYLFLKKRQGLVSSGIYKYIRHPQYLGVILFTSTFTAGSWFILAYTFGMSYITKEGTVLLWFLMVLGYIALAFAEEHFLSKQIGEDYLEYKKQTSLMFPFIKTSNRLVEVAIVFLISGLLLWIQIASFISYLYGGFFWEYLWSMFW